jgi:hypothetical protein
MVADYDSPWKEALDRYFELFLAFFFPQVHAAVDWSRGYEFLDKELQQLTADAELGRRYADKLVKVWLRDGGETWLLIHIEVQGQRDSDFPRRMYVYNYRIFDRYNHEVVSLAVLADDDVDWRPDEYRRERWGCTLSFRFPVVKLLDSRGHEAALEANANPFAILVLAHVKALETKTDSVARQLWKVRLVRGLYERGLTAEDVRQLFRLIDWLLELPPLLDSLFWQEVDRIEEERRMPYITSVERLGFERGRREERLEAIRRGLEIKFGEAGLQLLPEIEQLEDMAVLQAIRDAVWTATSLEELRRLWAK